MVNETLIQISTTPTLIIHIFNFINLLLSFAILILSGYYYLLIKNQKIKFLPKILVRYLCICGFPYAFIITFGSIILTLYFYITEKTTSSFYQLIRFSMVIASQQIRSSLFGVVIERIIATVYLERYKHKTNIIVFLMAFFTYSINGIYIFIAFSWIYLSSKQMLYHIATYVVVASHAMTLIICKILADKNKKMFKLLAYQITLKRRHTIFENIKVLKFLYPITLKFSLIAPIGPIATVINNFISNTTTPVAVFHLSYLIFFILVLVECIRILKQKKAAIIPVQTMYVKSPLGHELPKNQTTDAYFEELKRVWN